MQTKGMVCRRLIIVACFCLMVVSASDVKITRSSPRYGSENGETRLTLFGTDFPSSFAISPPTVPTKQVLLVSSFHEYDCKIHEAESDETQTVCYTSAMSRGVYYVRMKVKGISLDNSQYCGGNYNSWWCRFYVSYSRTPLLTELSPITNTPQEMMNMRGRLYTNLISSNEAEATNGNTAAITRVWLTSGACNCHNETTGDAYNIALDGQGESNWGNLNCKIESSYVGNQNLTFIVDGEYGRSLAASSIKKVSADNRLYMFQTYAVVDDVSPKTGSILGETLLTITGNFFDDLSSIRAEVLVGGENCSIQSVTDTEIKCLTSTPPTTSRSLYSGGRGVGVNILPGLSDIDANLSLASSTEWVFFDSTDANNIPGDNFLSRAHGFFIPAVTAQHTFTLQGDDRVLFSFNPSGSDPAAKIEMALNKPYVLTAGEEYYYEIRHIEYTSSAYFILSVHIDKSDYTPEQTSSARSEIQEIDITSDVSQEVQTVELINWEELTSDTPKSIWEVTLTCLDVASTCAVTYFKLSFFNTESQAIPYSSTSAVVQETLNRMVALGGDTVTVEGVSNGHRITFESSRGQFNLDSSSSNEAVLMVSTRNIEEGQPSLKTFTFSVNDYVSPPVSLSASETEIANAVKSLFGPNCPTQITKNIGRNSIADYDMEDGNTPDGREASSEKSFCGVYSLKNPNTIYKPNDEYSDIANIASIYQYVCFAHYGDIANSLRVSYSYNTEVESYDLVLQTFSGIGLLDSLKTWSHNCFNIYELLIARHSSGRSFRIKEIRIDSGSDDTTDLYVDNIFIGQHVISLEERKKAMDSIIRAAVQDVKLERVDVTKDDTKYTITFKPIDCGYSFPLLSVAFQTTTTKNSANHVTHVFGDDPNTSPQIHIKRESPASPAVGGTFDVNFEDAAYGSLKDLSASITDEEFKNKLESLLKVNNVEVIRSGTCYGYKWRVTFSSPGGDYPLMNTVGTALTFAPSAAQIKSKEIARGGLVMKPIYGDFLRTAHEKPQVQVFINGIPSHCRGYFDNDSLTSCDFEWLNLSTPKVTNVSPTKGPEKTLLTITVTGVDFSTSSDDSSVTIGGVPCVIATSTPTEITCNTGKSPAGNARLAVNIGSKGLADIKPSFATFQVSGDITSFTPMSGSQHGCTEITITGSGFDKNAEVTIGGHVCKVTNASYDIITCITSASTSAGLNNIIVTTLGVALTSSSQFDYATSGVAVIISTLPSSPLTVDGGVTFVISGNNFGSTEGKVYFGTTQAHVKSWSDTSIKILTPTLSAEVYDVSVVVDPIGCASGSFKVTYALSVSNVTPTTGSMAGGTKVTLDGTGFTKDAIVKFGSVLCSNVAVSNTGRTLTCTTESAGREHQVTNSGQHPTYGIGYAWSPSTLNMTVGDLMTVSWSYPDFVEGVHIGLLTTANASSTQFNGNGFEVEPTDKGVLHNNTSNLSKITGRFSYRFNNIGTYYYGGRCADCDIFMRGNVIVSAAENIVGKLAVTLNNHKANYNNDYEFTFDTSLTPTVTRISPNQGTTDQLITIEGSGFGSSGQTVTVGGKMCDIKSANDNTITCKVLASEKLSIAIYHEVSVNIDGKGDARIEISNALNRTFVLLAMVTSILPISGSTAGGTKITIQGTGFSASSMVKIANIDNSCVVKEKSYTTIVCVTEPSEESGSIAVLERAIEAECALSLCEFKFSTSATPTVTSWSPSVETWNKDTSSILYTFNGDGFGTDCSSITVYFTAGNTTQKCSVESCTDNGVDCTVPRYAVGTNIISLHVSGKGYASFANPDHTQTENQALIYSVDPSSGSVNGGTVLTIMGNGFVDGETSVSVGGVDCSIITPVQPDTVKCLTGRRTEAVVNIEVISKGITYPPTSYTYSSDSTPTVTAVSPTEGKGGDTITLSGTKFGWTRGDVIVKINDINCNITSINDVELQCILGAREGGTADIVVSVFNKGLASVSVTFDYMLLLSSISPTTGSYGGGQLITVNGEGFSNSTVVEVCSELCVIDGSVTSTELKCKTPPNADIHKSPTTCPVAVKNGKTTKTNGVKYTYDAASTPVISSVSPSLGGTAGGTRLTILGSGFASSAPTVTIDGSDCVVEYFTDSSIICETGPHQGAIHAKVHVKVGTSGIATQDAADYYYIDRWSSVFTWGGVSVPTQEDFVIIQQGQKILLDTHTNVLKMLLIDGGELIFDEGNVSLHAENILITNGGRLQIGTEDKPYEGKAEIVMYGHLRSPELPIYGAKTLGVRNGTLELHGKHIPNPWTTLANNAMAGSTQITLRKEAFGWNEGDYIVIASTGTRHSQKENEKRRITAVSADHLTLTLDKALEYNHHGFTDQFGDVPVEFRAEVGLLTRNVVFRGSNDHVWNDTIVACEEGFNTGQFATQTCFQGRFGEEVGSDQFGASIMIHSREPNTAYATAHIENIEVTYAGQAFRLGRYPIHFHLMGDVDGMYVKRCAIHNTFNRAVTIHGTHNLLVDSNVVYDVMGGAIFIEDGIETGNIIQYNLAVFVRQSTSLLNDDITPAAYWVTNPDNILRHNHAAGGTHFGFWYRMHEHPDGPSFDPNICQQKVELSEFSNNTVHSQGWFGIWIFQTYFPMEGSSCDSTVPSPAKFRSLTAWHCEKGAEWVNGGAIQFIDFVLVNHEVTGIDIKLISGTAWGHAKITNAVIVGHSRISESDYETQAAITLPFAPGLFIDGAKIFNFDRGGTVFFGTTVQGVCTHGCGGFYYWTERLSFYSVTKIVTWRWLHEGVIKDIDGSLTGAPNYSVVPYSEVMDRARCAIQTDVAFSNGLKSAFCEAEVRFHRFALNNPLPSSLEANDMIFTSKHGSTNSTYLKKRLTHPSGWMALLPSKEKIEISFKDGEQLTNITYNSRYYDLLEDDYLIITHQLLQQPDVIQINELPAVTVGSTSPITPISNNLDWHFDLATKKFTFLVKGTSRKRRAIEIVDKSYTHISVVPKIYRCFYKDCIEPLSADEIPPTRERPTDFLYFSAEGNPCLDWRDDNRTLFVKSSADGIDACWVVVDVPSIEVDNITIEGVLEFQKDLTIYVSSIHIVVLKGRLIAGFPDDEFTGTLNIELRGNHTTSDWSFPGIELGSKMIGCFGGCDFHGRKPDVYWTHLEQTAQPGAKVITLQKVTGWAVGDEIVITTTSYNSSETEVHVIESISGNKVTLVKTLAYRHMGETYTVGGTSFDMRAEVGLLTRNIKITGASYDTIDADAFGARVLVGSFKSSDNTKVNGWARISNIEFFQTGQEGWTEPWDPRFSLAWVNTGTTSNARPSYVSGCAFHDGFSTAIGTFGADDINITDNIVHRTIHDGIRLTGSGHRLERNLVTLTLFRGSYGDRFELTNFKDWQASFELSEANNLIMNGNTAAGSERLCFHFDGEACDAPEENAWTGNVAHGCLHGLHIFIGDGVGQCSMIRNFVVYKGWDFGIYHQTPVSIVIRNTTVADSTVAYLPLIFGPASLNHAFAYKSSTLEDFACIGRSKHFDPKLDIMDENNDKNLRVRAFGPNRKAPLTPTNGKTCIMLPLFQSGPNGAPFKPFHGNKNYPAIRGLLNITGFTAQGYGKHGNVRDLVFYTNPANGDAFHPTYLKEANFVDVELHSKVFYDRPSLGKINPSDCVDMECDAKKKVFIKDMDGTFLGEPGAVIPDAAYGWDAPDQLSRGLGDYRIPKTMLTATDGTRIPVKDIVDGRGIIGNKACEYVNEWQAFDCHGDDALDYRMLVIESLDDDTETRRLSPVALLGDRYIDLNNGPQDHGWCFGYTCQLRLSTFFTIVATGKHFDIFFTGNAPRKLRLHLLNVDDTHTVRVALWYTKPERLDVFVQNGVTEDESGLYVHPQNSVYDQDQDKWVLRKPSSANPDEYKPPIDAVVHGANYMDYNTNLMYITLRGSDPVDIRTAPAVVIKFGFPAVAIDDFFEVNLISNLASYLGVPEGKIRLVEVVRETSSRKKRSTSSDTVTYTIVFGDEITNSSVVGNVNLTAEILNNKTETMLLDYQTGHLWELINITTAGSLATSPAATNVTIGDETLTLIQHAIPRKLVVSSFPSMAEEYTAFDHQPAIAVLDDQDAVVSTLGGQWKVSVVLDTTTSTANDDATLLGNTTVMIVNGYANFTDLGITHLGSGYILRFSISQPDGVTLENAAPTIDVNIRTVNVTASGVVDFVNHNESVHLTLKLTNAMSLPLENIGFKGHSWKAEVRLDDSNIYGNTALSGIKDFTFSSSSGEADITGLTLSSTKSYHKYNLIFRIYTMPSLYNFNATPITVQFKSASDTLHSVTGATKLLKIVLTSTSTRTTSAEETLKTYLYNAIFDQLNNTAFIQNFDVATNTDGTRTLTFRMDASSDAAATLAVSTLIDFFSDRSNGLSYNGESFQSADRSCVVEEETSGVCYGDQSVAASVTPTETLETWVYVVIGVVAATLLAVGLITLSCVMKRAKTNKVGGYGGYGGCMDANSSRGSSPIIDSLYTSSSALTSTPDQFQSRMTPVQT